MHFMQNYTKLKRDITKLIIVDHLHTPFRIVDILSSYKRELNGCCSRPSS